MVMYHSIPFSISCLVHGLQIYIIYFYCVKLVKMELAQVDIFINFMYFNFPEDTKPFGAVKHGACVL